MYRIVLLTELIIKSLKMERFLTFLLIRQQKSGKEENLARREGKESQKVTSKIT